MKILFVRPRPSPETIGLQHVMLVEPLELEVLATLVGTGDIPVIIDMVLEKLPLTHFLMLERPDVFCVTGYITNVPEMKSYCRKAKKLLPQVITIVGGVHCEVCPQDLDDEYIDFRMVRNAVTAFPRLLEHLKGKGELPAEALKYQQSHHPEALPPFDFSFPLPDRSLTRQYRDKYFYIFHDKVALLKTSFGCPYSCTFCFCRAITRDRYYERPLAEVIQEIKLIQERNIYIVDDDFLSSRSRVQDFISAIRTARLDKQYLLYGRADFIAENPDLMKEFAELGLKTVIVGFESFSDTELDQYHKGISAETNAKAMKILNQYKIDCFATIIVSPEWGKADFEHCRKSLLALGIHYVNLQPLTPLPGTEMTAPREDLLFPYSDYHKWDLAHIAIQPSQMTVPDFYRAILKLYKAVLYQPPAVMKYLRSYSPAMLMKMLTGVYHVQKQYLKRIREASKDA